MSVRNQNSPDKSESLRTLNESKETLRDHDRLCIETDRELKKLLNEDQFLSDLPDDIAVDEVLALIAVTKGSGLKLFVEREGSPKLKVIISKIASVATVFDLKQSVRHAFELDQKREYKKRLIKYRKKLDRNSKRSTLSSLSSSPSETNSKCAVYKSRKKAKSLSKYSPPSLPPKINWRYIWKTYVLSYETNPLLDDKQSLSSYGIVNKSSLCFVKRVKIAKQQNQRKIS